MGSRTVHDELPDLYRDIDGLSLAVDGHVLRVTMDNPPLNAMTPAAHAGLARIWDIIDTDPAVRVVVLSGAGEKAFCAGGDLNAMVTNFGQTERWEASMVEARAIVVSMLACRKPIIARINGHAMGLGATIALACDITLVVADARLADPHVRVGLTAGDGGSLLWPHLTGLVTARRHLLTGDAMTGAEALAVGLVTEAVSRDQLDDRVSHWTQRFLATAPLALQTTKQALNMDILAKARAHLGEMLKLETMSWESPNHLEAVRAALAKRDPQFENE